MDFKNFNLGQMSVDMSKITQKVIPTQINPASLSQKEIQSMSDGEIKSILTGEKFIGNIIPLTLQMALSNELIVREIKRASNPLYMKLGLLLTFVTMCFSAWPIFQPKDNQPEVRKSEQKAPLSHHAASSSRQASKENDNTYSKSAPYKSGNKVVD